MRLARKWLDSVGNRLRAVTLPGPPILLLIRWSLVRFQPGEPINQLVMQHTSRHHQRFVRHLSGVATLAACGLFWVATAYCSPAEDFTDDKLLLQAGHEVAAMNRDQLEAFIDYVAVCGAPTTAPDKGLRCDIATTKFRIKNSHAPAIWRLVAALGLTSHLVEIGWDRATAAERKTLGDYLMRGTEIFNTFQTNAATRYADLTQQRSTTQP